MYADALCGINIFIGLSGILQNVWQLRMDPCVRGASGEPVGLVRAGKLSPSPRKTDRHESLHQQTDVPRMHSDAALRLVCSTSKSLLVSLISLILLLYITLSSINGSVSV